MQWKEGKVKGIFVTIIILFSEGSEMQIEAGVGEISYDLDLTLFQKNELGNYISYSGIPLSFFPYLVHSIIEWLFTYPFESIIL
ncbi:hypothetical protein [Bacillus sp. LL01]|uniref:hypothetical protein n=1 Tax=Bacillus sp. LL01 TaxID=1665556 RepID=UPI0018E3D882|nr:hypothetical protein [Bacillus sp. LL01]